MAVTVTVVVVMLLLAHTWILKEFLALDPRKCRDPDIYIHNLSPDILTIHEAIKPVTTHGISRFRNFPSRYKKAAFVQFHLLVDDMAHYGEITDDLNNVFNPDSGGYCYVKGKALIGPIVDFYKSLGKEISYSHAAYRSHIIIKMVLDHILHQEERSNKLMDFFHEALRYTFDYKLNEFSETMAWLFGISKETIVDAMRQALEASTSPIRGSFMNSEDHTSLYIEKFCPDREDEFTKNSVANLLNQAVNLVPDYEAFLLATVASIKKWDLSTPYEAAKGPFLQNPNGDISCRLSTSLLPRFYCPCTLISED